MSETYTSKKKIRKNNKSYATDYKASKRKVLEYQRIRKCLYLNKVKILNKGEIFAIDFELKSSDQ